VRFSIVSTLRETTLADLLVAEHPVPTGPALPSLDIEPLTTGA
jgi:hypothetical protein